MGSELSSPTLDSSRFTLGVISSPLETTEETFGDNGLWVNYCSPLRPWKSWNQLGLWDQVNWNLRGMQTHIPEGVKKWGGKTSAGYCYTFVKPPDGLVASIGCPFPLFATVYVIRDFSKFLLWSSALGFLCAFTKQIFIEQLLCFRLWARQKALCS